MAENPNTQPTGASDETASGLSQANQELLEALGEVFQQFDPQTGVMDGSPQVTPVWVDYEDGLILVNTAVGRVKQKNTKVNPKVAISIADASNQYDMITIRGRVVEQSTAGAEDHIHKLAKKYLSKEKYPWLSPSETRIILKIEPEHYTA